MKESLEVYRIIDKQSNEPQGVYWRGNYDKYDFESVESARSSNVHGIYKDKVKYNIAKYKVTYQLIDNDCDNSNSDKEYVPPPYDSLMEVLGDALIKSIGNRAK